MTTIAYNKKIYYLCVTINNLKKEAFMKRILFFLLCSLMSMQIFSQNEISKELFPTLVGWERTNFIFYYNDGCSNETKSIHIASPTEIDFIDGKPYLYWGDFFLREENNKVFIYSFAYE